VLFRRPTCAHVLGVPDREPAVGRAEKCTELVVEVRDCRLLLEELILEPALGIAGVSGSLVKVERGAALVTGHVAGPEHVFRRIGSRRQLFSLVGSAASAGAAALSRFGEEMGALREREEGLMAQDNVGIARSLYDHWNERQFDKIAELMAADSEIVLVGSDTRFRGPSGAIEFSQMWADGFPDGRVTMDNVVASGDHVVLQFTGKGTQTGVLKSPTGEIPATGRSITLKLCDVHEI
jgi:predicted ester cyclase